MNDMSTSKGVFKACLLAVIVLASISQIAEAAVEMNGSWREKTATRDRFCLNGEWDFHPLEGNKHHHWYAGPEIADVNGFDWKMKLRVPGTWSGGGWYHEYKFLSDADAVYVRGCLRAWYKREFFVPAEWAGKQIVLEFGGVGYKAAVYINGKLIGGHVGGYTPFEIDVTDAVKLGGVNEILVFNNAFRRGWTTPKDGVLRHLDSLSGIWGDVYLRASSKVFVDNVFVKTSVRKGQLTAILEIVNRDKIAHTVNVANVVTDGDKAALTLPNKEVTVPAGGMVKVEVAKNWAKPRYWSLQDPHLYFMKTKITENGKEVDATKTRFGFREFWIDGKDFRLNGEIVRLMNFPIIGYGPDQARPEYIRGWYKLMKEKLNFNCVRFQKIYPPIFIEIADEVGILVEDGTGLVGGDEKARWNWPESKEINEKEIAEWVRSRRNNPSIVIWSAENECWSMVDVKKYRDGDPTTIGIYNWLLSVGDWISAHDDTRPVTYHHVGIQFDYTKSYSEENFEAGDLMGKLDHYSLHYPEHNRYVSEQIEIGKYWAKNKNKPLMISEFGGPKAAANGISSDFSVNGEALASHHPAERESSYYFYRRIVGAWRAAGMSGIYTWTPNIFSVRQLKRNHQFQWDDLTTPGFKPVRTNYFAYNPGWDANLPEYVPDSATDAGDHYFWKMLYDSFSPLLINLGGNYWEHNYLSGEKVVKTAHIVNDTTARQKVKWSWQLQENGKRIAGATRKIKLERAEIKQVSFKIKLPKTTERKELKLILTATAGDDFKSEDILDITVYPKKAVAPPKYSEKRIALYDTVGKTAKVLDKAGVSYKKIDTLAGPFDLAGYKLVVIGCDSADSALTGTAIQKIQKFTESGGRVLVFEQSREIYNNLNLIYPGIMAPPIENLAPSFHPSSYADVAAPGHPIFDGLKSSISFWKGEHGRIAEFHYARPFGTSARSLLFSAKWSGSLIEGTHGDGRYLLCQTNVTTRYGKDPEATILMHNLLDYALTAGPVVKTEAASIGPIGGLLGKANMDNMTGGFTADDISGKLAETDLSKYKVLILGKETLTANSEVTKNAKKILTFLEAGGTVFALGQNSETFKADWLPGKITIRDMTSEYIFKEKTTDPLLWGVSAFDLTKYYSYPFGLLNPWPEPKVSAEFYDFSNDWTSLLLVSKEPPNWDVASDESVGGIFPTGGSALLRTEHGKGKIYLCQLDLGGACDTIKEEAFEDLDIKNLAPRMIADAMLTNLGLAPAKAPEQARPETTDRQLVWMGKQLGGDKKMYPIAWKVIGLFENLDNKSYSVAQGPEADMLAGKAPAESYTGYKGESVSWKVVDSGARNDGFVNLDMLYGQPDWVTAYATMTINSPKDRKAVFFLGSDDGYRLWLNGKLAGEHDIARMSGPMQEVLRVDLKAGDNVVLLKIAEWTGGFDFYFSMMAEDGTILKDCTTEPVISPAE